MKNRYPAVLLLACFFSAAGAFAYSANDYYQAGLKNLRLGQVHTAIQYFQVAVQMDPKDWQAYQALGTAQYQSGDEGAAVVSYQKSLKINPENPRLRKFVNEFYAVHFGPKIGAGFFTLYGSNVSGAKSMTGFQLGMMARIPLDIGFGFQPELEFIQKGAQSSEDGVTATTTLNYLEFPLLLRFELFKDFGFLVGPGLGINVGGSVSSNGQSQPLSDLVPFDFGGIAGLDYTINKTIDIDLRLDYGVETVYNVSPSVDVKNQGFDLAVGYLF